MYSTQLIWRLFLGITAFTMCRANFRFGDTTCHSVRGIDDLSNMRLIGSRMWKRSQENLSWACVIIHHQEKRIQLDVTFKSTSGNSETFAAKVIEIGDCREHQITHNFYRLNNTEKLSLTSLPGRSLLAILQLSPTTAFNVSARIASQDQTSGMQNDFSSESEKICRYDKKIGTCKVMEESQCTTWLFEKSDLCKLDDDATCIENSEYVKPMNDGRMYRYVLVTIAERRRYDCDSRVNEELRKGCLGEDDSSEEEEDEEDEEGDRDVLVIACVVIAGIVLIIITLIVMIYFCLRLGNNQQPQPTTSTVTFVNSTFPSPEERTIGMIPNLAYLTQETNQSNTRDTEYGVETQFTSPSSHCDSKSGNNVNIKGTENTDGTSDADRSNYEKKQSLEKTASDNGVAPSISVDEAAIEGKVSNDYYVNVRNKGTMKTDLEVGLDHDTQNKDKLNAGPSLKCPESRMDSDDEGGEGSNEKVSKYIIEEHHKVGYCMVTLRTN